MDEKPIIKYTYTNKKGSLEIYDSSTQTDTNIIIKFIPDDNDGEFEIGNTNQFIFNGQSYNYCECKVEVNTYWYKTILSTKKGDKEKWRYKLYFKKNCTDTTEKPFILSTKWVLDHKKDITITSIKNVIMIFKESNEEPEPEQISVTGGKKNRKSRRKSRRIKKTAKRRR
jgi:hypothetical protein